VIKPIPVVTAAVLALSVSLATAAEIKVGGGGAAIATIFTPVKAAFEKATGDNLIILQSTPGRGLGDLVNGKLDAAVAAVPLDSMIAGAEKDGVKVDRGALQQLEIGINKVAVFVHPSNPVSSLTKEQIKGLFTGKISNWKDVGGKDSPVIVVWGKNSPGQNALFTKVLLDGEKIAAENLETTDYKGIKDTVSSNPEAIGIDPLGMADATVKAIKPNPEATSPIRIVTKGAPSAGVQKLINFIKTEGKKYIAE
jgi:phosphate transport system substrate-binding protein